MGRHDSRTAASFDAAELVAAEANARLGNRHILLLTDFDGTLADLAPTPDAAVLSAAVGRELVRLERLPRVTTGVVSGRRLDDVRRRVGSVPEYIAGLHGLEITGPSERFHHTALDDVRPAIAELTRLAVRELAWCRGLYLEDKTYALTCHVRLASPEDGDRALQEFEALAEPQLEARVLRLLTGKKAHELLPAVDWHKGRAIAWIRSRVAATVPGPAAIVYLGDDRTDEDAFAALGDDDLAIGVGDRPHTHLIDWRLDGPVEVGRFFGHLAAAVT